MAQKRLNEVPATAGARTKRRIEILKAAPVHEQLEALWEALEAPKGTPTPRADKVRAKIAAVKNRYKKN